jgi:hypothetical protein
VRVGPVLDKIARQPSAEHSEALGGVFGTAQLAEEIRARFQTPARGGRSTDPSWSEKRLVSLAPKTLQRLSHLSERMSEQEGVTVSPLQLAALLLELAVAEVDEGDHLGQQAG